MDNFRKALLALFALILLSGAVLAQDDEARAASGLPTFIGPRPGTDARYSSTLSGSLVIQGYDENNSSPSLTVAIYAGGSLIDRRFVQNRGSFIFNGLPTTGLSLTVEADGMEVARVQVGVLNPPPLGNRQDIIITAAQIGQVAERKKEMTALLNSYPRSDENQKLFDKALAAGKEKKTDGAQKLFKQLLTADPADFVAWSELGNIYFKAEKFSDAERAYNKALELKPDFGPTLLNGGKFFLSQKNLTRSIELLEKAVAQTPNSAEANRYLGEAFLQNRLGSKAVVYLNKAIDLDPVGMADAHLSLAALYNAANLKDRAVKEYKLFLQKVPNYPEKAKIEKYISDNSPK